MQLPFTGTVDESYVLSRDAIEQHRLQVQHAYMVKFVYNGRLIFDEEVRLPDGARILDAGTGTGAWLIDLAQHLPQSVTLHGIDASALQFPECVVPANIRFDIMKITELPESWTSRFDFVQQRLLIGGLRASDWPLALSNYIRALKPGGYIQLVEPVSRSRDQCGPSGKRLVELQEQLFLRKGLLYDCAEQLPSLLRRAGFVEVRSEKRLGPVGEVLGPDGKVGKMVSAGSIRAMGEAMVKAELIESTDELDAIVTELEQFWEMDGGFYMAYWIVTAKTPLARL